MIAPKMPSSAPSANDWPTGRFFFWPIAAVMAPKIRQMTMMVPTPMCPTSSFFLSWIGTSRSGVFDDVDPKLGHRPFATVLSLVDFRTLNLAPHGDCVAADHIGEN